MQRLHEPKRESGDETCCGDRENPRPNNSSGYTHFTADNRLVAPIDDCRLPIADCRLPIPNTDCRKDQTIQPFHCLIKAGTRKSAIGNLQSAIDGA